MKPYMAKLISTESSILFLEDKFYKQEHMAKIEVHKNSQNFLSKETIYHN